MKNIFEYLLTFVFFSLCMPNNYLSIIYLALNFVALLVIILIYAKHRQKGEKIGQIDLIVSLDLLMILALNIYCKLGSLNLIVGGVLLLYFVIYCLSCFRNKNYELKGKNLLNSGYIFDFYCVLYLINLLGK